MLLLDKIIWGFLAIFFLSGWFRGILKTLIGPIAFILCFIAAVIFYDLNRNILMAFVITFAGTIALTISLSLLLTIVTNSVNKEYRGKVFLLSRILGAGTNVAWQGNILFIGLILFSVCPLKEGVLLSLKEQVPESPMIAFYKNTVVQKSVEYHAIVASIESLRDPNAVETMRQTAEFKAFQNDSNYQAFITDPQVIAAFNKNDLVEVLKAPTLRKLVTNDGSMSTLTELTEIVYTNKLNQLTPSADSVPSP